MTFKVQVLYSIAFFVVLQGTVDAACPAVAPKANFSAASFLGVWYGIQRYQTTFNALATKCHAINSTVSNQRVFNLELCNFFTLQNRYRILGTLASSGFINYRFTFGASEFNFWILCLIFFNPDFLNSKLRV